MEGPNRNNANQQQVARPKPFTTTRILDTKEITIEGQTLQMAFNHNIKTV
jgi:hypothetical protein